MRLAIPSALLLAGCSFAYELPPATAPSANAAQPHGAVKQVTPRRPAWRSEIPAHRVETSTRGATVLLDDGRAWFWADGRTELPSYRAGPGAVPGAAELVDICGPFGVHADGTMGQTMSNGGYRRGDLAEQAVRSCAFNMLPNQLCVVGRDGGVRCRFGSGSRTQLAPVSRRHDFERVVVSDHVGCALTSEAALHCWSDDAPRAEPVLDQVRDVAISARGVCAVRVDGTLWCRPRETRRPFRPDPSAGQPGFQPMPLTDVAHVALRNEAGVAITTDGRAMAWGRHDGFWSHDDGPAEVSWLRGARFVGIERDAVCAILADGHAACWNRAP